MKTRQLTRADLPERNLNCNSLHIPVIHKGESKFVCDIHFGNNSLCYLEDAKGIPTEISELQLIIGEYFKNLNKEKSQLETQKRFCRRNKKEFEEEAKQRLNDINRILQNGQNRIKQ
jgi:hypothetical protein